MLVVCLVSLLHYLHKLFHQLLTILKGEDALANLSVEQDGEDGPITGFVRIRSRSQGLALSLGNLKGLNKAGEAK